MKTTIWRSTQLFSLVAAVMLAMIMGCQSNIGNGNEAQSEKFTVTFSVNGEGGTLSVKAEDIAETGRSPIILGKGKIAVFTANPDFGYAVDTWNILGGSFEWGTAGTGEKTARVRGEGNITVTVTFKSSYAIVAFGTNGAGLDAYLKNQASDSAVNYIEVTGLTKEDMKGPEGLLKAGSLGEILKKNSTKKVALKFGSKIKDLTEMNWCFFKCESLVQAPAIPAGVMSMRNCFSGCKNLMKAPVLPPGVINLEGCFDGCKSLTQAPEIPPDVTNMRFCFAECKNLTRSPSKIPEKVTDMENCFSDCANLGWVPDIPAQVKHIRFCFSHCEKLTSVTLKCPYNQGKTVFGDPSFEDAFKECTGLKAGSIKVSADQLAIYKKNADVMRIAADRFIAE